MCQFCDENLYLQSNKCMAVTGLIDQCKYYEDNSTCSMCRLGYYLENNVCVVATAMDCLTYESKTKCATCPMGRGLKTESGVTNCVQFTDQNCLDSTMVYPFECLKCKPGYYPNDSKVCEKVTNPIEHCVTHDTQTTCVSCDSMSILSQTRKSCITTPEAMGSKPSNCVEAMVRASNKCSLCAPGYHFVDGVCTACSQNKITDGCLYCDPMDESVCMLCNTGFFQKSNGDCEAIGIVSPDDDDSTSTNAFSLLSSIVFFLLLV